MEEKCENCRFMRRADDGTYECHLHPPVTIVVGSGRAQSWAWPTIVSLPGWCGDYQENRVRTE